ncbi:hypothetical protein AMS68_007186 [Peltaster fructicola]|uniref:XRCC4 coiled-coil domain-containing protein n=1 Tax=Peltaster fructicola TaxID=286661 RepID=A0A6H0Y494_9PEZI|nr:hypothetical protein AMS68_007186 [Peltaster fructicola]
MASQTVRILRVKRADDASQHLLVHITPTNVKKALDVKLVATEHEHVYHGEIRSTQINALRSEHFDGDGDELRDIIRFIFLQTRPALSTPGNLKGLETVASRNKDSFVITIRKNIGGITQRVASVSLAQDDEREEILPFDWVDTAVQISEQQWKDLEATQTTLDAQQKEIDSLKSQLEEFIKVKKEHEDDMLQKFAVLLNTKKRRIRELRQRLERAGADNDDDAHMADVPDAEQQAKPSTSRGSKRKAPQTQSDVDMEEAEGEETPQETEDEDGGTDVDVDDRQSTQSSRTARSQTVKHGHTAEVLPAQELLSQSHSQRASASVAPQSSMPDPEDDETDDEL